METVIIGAALLLFATFAVAIVLSALYTVWNLAGIDQDIRDVSNFSKKVAKKMEGTKLFPGISFSSPSKI